jgi:hypothetical protein
MYYRFMYLDMSTYHVYSYIHLDVKAPTMFICDGQPPP